MEKIFFQSDNTSGVHPTIMQAMIDANKGHTLPYGADDYAKNVQQIFKDLSQKDCDVLFVLGGTGGNVLALDAMMNSYEALICTDVCHVHTTEAGAYEKIAHAKILTTKNHDGKIDLDDAKAYLRDYCGNFHHSQPSVISIANTTEVGTVYTVQEVKAICDFAHDNGLKVHMDGARISNALAYLGCTYKELVVDTGVDVITFGGTKNGMMFGEALVFYDKESYAHAKYLQKQNLQLISKLRFIPCQFEAFFKDDLYLKLAKHANDLIVHDLQEGLKKFPQVIVSNTLQSNQAFLVLNNDVVEKLQERFYFVINRDLGHQKEIRLVTSFISTKEEVQAFLDCLQEIFG